MNNICDQHRLVCTHPIGIHLAQSTGVHHACKRSVVRWYQATRTNEFHKAPPLRRVPTTHTPHCHHMYVRKKRTAERCRRTEAPIVAKTPPCCATTSPPTKQRAAAAPWVDTGKLHTTRTHTTPYDDIIPSTCFSLHPQGGGRERHGVDARYHGRRRRGAANSRRPVLLPVV